MIRGFDASPAQGRVDFKACKAAGLEFVILECWIGNDGPSKTFEAQAKAAIEAELVVMAYGFFYPLKPDPKHPGRDAKEQARAFVEYAWKTVPGCLILVDVEWPPPEEWAKWKIDAAWISKDSRILCEEVTRLCFGKKPTIYTYLYWWDHLAAGADVAWAAAYALWQAWYVKHWPTAGESPRIRKPWTTWLFWQWDGDGGEKLPNGADADFCVFNGTREELLALNATPAREQALAFADTQPIVHPDVPLDAPAPPDYEGDDASSRDPPPDGDPGTDQG